MILTVKPPFGTVLNARDGAPSTTVRVAGTVAAGAKLDITDVMTGTMIEGVDVWYRCTDGCYYWSGSFLPPAANFVAGNYTEKKIVFLADKTQAALHRNSADETKWTISRGHVDMEIWKVWRDYGTRGEGVKVAVIDSGVHAELNDLKGRIAGSTSFVGDMEDASPYHGTMSAGLVGANGGTAKTVYGVAPGCELYVYKAATDGYTVDKVSLALQQAAADGAKIISMSFAMNDDVALQSWAAFCDQNGMLLVAAAGDVNSGEKMYPASYEECISVGGYCFSAANARQINRAESNHNDALTLLGPSKDVLTTSINAAPAYHQATSAACAFVAGTLALAAARYPLLNRKMLKAMLAGGTLTDSIEKTGTQSQEEGYGVLNMSKLMQALSKQ